MCTNIFLAKITSESIHGSCHVLNEAIKRSNILFLQYSSMGDLDLIHQVHRENFPIKIWQHAQQLREARKALISWKHWSRDDTMEVLEVVEIAMKNRNGCKEKYPHMQMDEHCEFYIKWHFFKTSFHLTIPFWWRENQNSTQMRSRSTPPTSQNVPGSLRSLFGEY